MAVPTRAKVESIIAERIAADPGFRQTLLGDPRAVLSEIVGFEIPESVQVVLHEESLTQIHLTIPAAETSVTPTSNWWPVVPGPDPAERWCPARSHDSRPDTLRGRVDHRRLECSRSRVSSNLSPTGNYGALKIIDGCMS